MKMFRRRAKAKIGGLQAASPPYCNGNWEAASGVVAVGATMFGLDPQTLWWWWLGRVRPHQPAGEISKCSESENYTS